MQGSSPPTSSDDPAANDLSLQRARGNRLSESQSDDRPKTLPSAVNLVGEDHEHMELDPSVTFFLAVQTDSYSTISS